MTDNAKKVLHLIKYGYQTKMNLGLGVFFLLFGIFMKFVGVIASGFEVLFILMLPIFFCQILYGLGCVQMSSSSSLKRWLTVYMPDIITDVLVFLGLVLYYVISLIARENNILYIWGDSMEMMDVGGLMACGGVMAFMLMCYIAGCYKYYWAFTVLFVVVMAIYGGVSAAFDEYLRGVSQAQGVAIAALMYVAGVIVSGAIRRLTYKVPVSSIAVGKRLGNQI